MKFFNKLTFMTMAVLIAGSFGLLSPAFTASVGAATNSTRQGSIITLTDYTRTYTETSAIPNSTAKGVRLPTASASSGTLSVTAKSAGVNVPSANIILESGNYYLVTTGNGDYQITYSVKNSDNITTATRDIIVSLDTEESSLEFAKNSQQIIPSKVVADYEVNLPNPTIVSSDEAVADVVITAADYVTSGDGVYLEVNKNKNGTVTNVTTALTVPTGKNYKQYKVLTADTDSTFTVTYSLKQNGAVVSRVDYQFTVVDQIVDAELEYSALSEAFNSLSIQTGVETTLPTPTVLKNGVEVTVYTEILVKLQGGTDEQKVTLTGDNFAFVPAWEGTYDFIYTSVDAYGKSVTMHKYKDNVTKTSSSIKVIATNDYNLADVATMKTNFDTLVNSNNLVPSIVYATSDYAGTDFPAIFATGGYGQYADLELKRTIYKNSVKVVTLEDTIKTGTDKYTTNETAKYTFATPTDDDAVSYTVEYTAHYKNTTNTNKTITYNINVYKYAGTTADAIANADLSISNIKAPAYAAKNATLTISAPTANDYLIGSESTVVGDSNLEISITAKAGTYDLVVTKNEAGKYEIAIDKPAAMDEATWNGLTAISITATAINDLGKTATTSTNVGLSADFSDDNVAPSITEGFMYLGSDDMVAAWDSIANTFVKNDIITLPTIQFSDTSPLTVDVYVTKNVNDAEGNVVSSRQVKKFTYNGISNVVAGNSEFTPTESATGDSYYAITYIATDANSNKLATTLTFNVISNDGYTLSMDAIADAEYGDIIELTQYLDCSLEGVAVSNSQFANVQLYVNNAEQNAMMLKENFVNDSTYVAAAQANLDSLPNNTLYILVNGLGCRAVTTQDLKTVAQKANPIETSIMTLDGDITIQAWAKTNGGICDLTNNATNAFTFESSDTLAPEASIIGTRPATTSPFDATANDESNKIVLPWFASATDLGVGVDEESYAITVKYAGATKNLKEFDYHMANSFDDLFVTPTKSGTLVVTYSVSDLAGNTWTESYNIAVGDITPPTIKLADNTFLINGVANDLSASVAQNAILKINLKDYVTIGADSTLDYQDVEIKVTCDGADVSFTRASNAEDITLTLENAGNYVISFNVSDSAGNAADTVTKAFQVSAGAVNTSTNSTVWGTILIIVSLIVLGVVIYFFVKPSRGGNKIVQKEKEEKVKK